MANTIDTISGSSGLIAAVASILTLLTVYVAAIQISARRQLYQLGLSTNSLGKWKEKVVSGSLWVKLGLIIRIRTPSITFRQLLRNGWKPFNEDAKAPLQPISVIQNLGRMLSFPGSSSDNTPDPESLPETSWVNFLSALGIQPESGMYELQPEPELFNGIVPMRWKGSDLAALCSMFAFQTSNLKQPDPRKPMPMPSQWSGPLGVLQFRASSDGCVVEFRPRPLEGYPIQLPAETRTYYKVKLCPSVHLIRRAWQSIGGFYFGDTQGATLYLAGAPYETSAKKPLRTTEEVMEQLIAMQNPTDSELRDLVFGPDCEQWHIDGPSHDVFSESHFFGFDAYSASRRKGSNSEDRTRLTILSASPGLLHTIVEGIWAHSRGLDYRSNVHGYMREYVTPQARKQRQYPFQIGSMCMDEDLLRHLKSAMLDLKPDGFYYSPIPRMAADIDDLFQDIHSHLEYSEAHYIFHPDALHQLSAHMEGRSDLESAYNAMHVVNAIHSCARRERPNLRMEVIKLISKASMDLWTDLEPIGRDLEWALLMSPMLFEDLFKRLCASKFDFLHFMNERGCLGFATLEGDLDGYTEKVVIDNYKIPYLEGTIKPWPSRLTGVYKLKCVDAPAAVSGRTVMHAFLSLLLTYFWVTKLRISTTVAYYDLNIPISITMV